MSSHDILPALATVISALIAGVAAYFAAKAEKNSRPVSNGFAKEVVTDLRELRQMMTRHLESHAKD